MDLGRFRIVWFMVVPFILTWLAWDGWTVFLLYAALAYFMLKKNSVAYRYVSPFVSSLALGTLSVSLELPLALLTGGYLYIVLFWVATYLIWPE